MTQIIPGTDIYLLNNIPSLGRHRPKGCDKNEYDWEVPRNSCWVCSRSERVGGTVVLHQTSTKWHSNPSRSPWSVSRESAEPQLSIRIDIRMDVRIDIRLFIQISIRMPVPIDIRLDTRPSIRQSTRIDDSRLSIPLFIRIDSRLSVRLFIRIHSNR